MSTAPKKKDPRSQVFVFIDTNIFLDYYRSTNNVSLQLLEKLPKVKEFIISTYQVEMEFKKNRQSVIQETLKGLKFTSNASLPVVFQDSASSQSLAKLKSDAKKKLDIIEKRFVNLLKNPKKNDVVYKTLDDIFHNPSDHVLTRDMDIRHEIKDSAWRRFILGYPPRKSTDTSTGDAINWEWLIHCGNSFSGKIIIVTRDGDFGIKIKDKSFLNDHLKQEYSQRVGERRPILLTDKLSVALKMLDIPVTEEEEEAELKQLLDSPSKLPEGYEDLNVPTPFEKFIEMQDLRKKLGI